MIFQTKECAKGAIDFLANLILTVVWHPGKLKTMNSFLTIT